jgi:hypothetical protein
MRRIGQALPCLNSSAEKIRFRALTKFAAGFNSASGQAAAVYTIIKVQHIVDSRCSVVCAFNSLCAELRARLWIFSDRYENVFRAA